MQNADNLENSNSGLIHTFSKPNASIHGVCSVLSFHAVFAFQNFLLGFAEKKGANMYSGKLRLFTCGILNPP